jgi:hypothetical protein
VADPRQREYADLHDLPSWRIKQTRFLGANDLFSARHLRDPSSTIPYSQPLDSPPPHINTPVFRSTEGSATSSPRGRWSLCSQTRTGAAVSWSQRVPWIHIHQTCGVCLILVHPFFPFYLCQLTRTTVIITQGALAGDADPLHPKATVLTEVSSACRPLLLPSALRVPQVGCSPRILTALVNFSFLLSFHSSAEHSYSHNQNQPQSERRNEYNDPLNDPSSTWSNYGASRSTSSVAILVSNSPLFSVGQQSAFSNDDDPRLQYSYPAPQQVAQPYQSYRDPSTSYSNPTTLPLPRINVPENHPRDDRWPQHPYGGTSGNRAPETVFSPIASYPAGTSFQYPPQHPTQGMLPDTRFSLPINPPTSSSTGAVRRGPVSVERTATRSSAHTTTPYSRSDIPSDHPPPKKKRKRADAEQLRVLNEVYARTAFPSTEERQELAIKLNMTPRSVQIWYVSSFLHHRPHLTSPLGFRTNDRQCVTHTVSQAQFEGRTTNLALIAPEHLGPDRPHRMCRLYPCPRIDQAASVRTLIRPLTSPHLPPTPLITRCRAHRSLSRAPLGSIGPRAGIGRTSMTITTAVQDVIEYDAFCRWSILVVLRENTPPPRYQNFPSCQHSRPFVLLCISFRHIYCRTVTRIRALVWV